MLLLLDIFYFFLQDFILYYKRQVDSKIDGIGGWILKSKHSIERIDTNASESFNCVLKRFQEWNEVPLDVIALGCEQHCRYYDVEIERGRYNLETYRIKPELSKNYCRSTAPPEFPKSVVLEQIVDNLQKKDYLL